MFRSSPFLFHIILPPPSSTLFPYTTLFRSDGGAAHAHPRPLLAYPAPRDRPVPGAGAGRAGAGRGPRAVPAAVLGGRSEEHTSELQSRLHLVCRLLLEKKKQE